MSNKPHNFKDRRGEKFITKQGYEIEIIEYFNALNCTVQFDDNIIIKNKTYDNIIKGKIENPNHRTVFGIGYIGFGKYLPTYKGKMYKNYNIWKSMIQRSYCQKTQEKSPSYKVVSVCDDWHNFQNFAAWFEENYVD